MITEDFDLLFSLDVFARNAQYIPTAGPTHDIQVIFNEPFVDPNGVESNEYTAVAEVAKFITYPVRGDEIIISAISYLVITPEKDITGTVLTLQLEVK